MRSSNSQVASQDQKITKDIKFQEKGNHRPTRQKQKENYTIKKITKENSQLVTTEERVLKFNVSLIN